MPRELSYSELENFPSLDWFDIAPRLTPAVRASLGTNSRNSKRQRRSRWKKPIALAHAEGDDLLGLLAAANLLRAELVGNLVTYVVNRNINFTNICFVGCKFCAFSRGPRESDTYFLEPGSSRAKSRRSLATRRHRSLHPGRTAARPASVLLSRHSARGEEAPCPAMHIHAFSPMEIVYGVELTGMPLADYLSMLRDNGLDTLPGTAAEILDDEIRHILSRQQTLHRAMDRGHSHRPPLRHPHPLRP